MRGIVELQLWQFALVYVLLVVTAIVMRACRVDQTKQLIIANIRMAVQLVIAGLILTYLFEYPHPALTIGYIAVMTAFTIGRVLRKNPGLNRRFQVLIGGSIAVAGLVSLAYFIACVVGESLLNPQYAIPVAGMIMGNAMTGTSLAVKTFRESLPGQRARINALLCAGSNPRTVLLPFARQALETALVPTMNSMMSMGIVSLPGMMTGQILSGTMPMTAILYQIAIFVTICAVVMLSCAGALFLGMRTLYRADTQLIDLKQVGVE